MSRTGGQVRFTKPLNPYQREIHVALVLVLGLVVSALGLYFLRGLWWMLLVGLITAVVIVWLVRHPPSPRQIILDKSTDRLLRNGRLVGPLSEIDRINVCEAATEDTSWFYVEAVLRNGKRHTIARHDSARLAEFMAKPIASYLGIQLEEDPTKEGIELIFVAGVVVLFVLLLLWVLLKSFLNG